MAFCLFPTASLHDAGTKSRALWIQKALALPLWYVSNLKEHCAKERDWVRTQSASIGNPSAFNKQWYAITKHGPHIIYIYI